MATPNVRATYELLLRAMQQQSLHQQGADFGSTPNGAPEVSSDSYGSSPQGGLLGRLLVGQEVNAELELGAMEVLGQGRVVRQSHPPPHRSMKISRLAGNCPQNPDSKELKYQNPETKGLRAIWLLLNNSYVALRMISERGCGRQGQTSHVD